MDRDEVALVLTREALRPEAGENWNDTRPRANAEHITEHWMDLVEAFMPTKQRDVKRDSSPTRGRRSPSPGEPRDRRHHARKRTDRE